MHRVDRGHNAFPPGSEWGKPGLGVGGSVAAGGAGGSAYQQTLLEHLQALSVVPRGNQGDQGYYTDVRSPTLDVYQKYILAIRGKSMLYTIGNLESNNNKVLLKVFTMVPFSWDSEGMTITWSTMTIGPPRRIGANQQGAVPTFGNGGTSSKAVRVAYEFNYERDIMLTKAGRDQVEEALVNLSKNFMLAIYAYLVRLLFSIPNPPVCTIYTDEEPMTMRNLMRDFLKHFGRYNKGEKNSQEILLQDSKSRSAIFNSEPPSFFFGTARHALLRNFQSNDASVSEAGEVEAAKFRDAADKNYMRTPGITSVGLELTKDVFNPAHILTSDLTVGEFAIQERTDYKQSEFGIYLPQPNKYVFISPTEFNKAIFDLFGTTVGGKRYLNAPTLESHLNGIVVKKSAKAVLDHTKGKFLASDGTLLQKIQQLSEDTLPVSLVHTWIKEACKKDHKERTLLSAAANGISKMFTPGGSYVPIVGITTKELIKALGGGMNENDEGLLLAAATNAMVNTVRSSQHPILSQISPWIASLSKWCEGSENMFMSMILSEDDSACLFSGDVNQMFPLDTLKEPGVNYKSAAISTFEKVLAKAKASSAVTRGLGDFNTLLASHIAVATEKLSTTNAEFAAVDAAVRGVYTNGNLYPGKDDAGTVNTVTAGYCDPIILACAAQVVDSKFKTVGAGNLDATVGEMVYELRAVVFSTLSAAFRETIQKGDVEDYGTAFGRGLGFWHGAGAKHTSISDQEAANLFAIIGGHANDVTIKSLKVNSPGEKLGKRGEQLNLNGPTAGEAMCVAHYFSTELTEDGLNKLHQLQLQPPYRKGAMVYGNVYTGDTSMAVAKGIGFLGVTDTDFVKESVGGVFHQVNKMQISFGALVQNEAGVHRHHHSAVSGYKRAAKKTFFTKSGKTNRFRPDNITTGDGFLLPFFLTWTEEDPANFISPMGFHWSNKLVVDANAIVDNADFPFAFSSVILHNFRDDFKTLWAMTQNPAKTSVEARVMPDTISFPLVCVQSSHKIINYDGERKEYQRDGLWPGHWGDGSYGKRVGIDSNATYGNQIEIMSS